MNKKNILLVAMSTVLVVGLVMLFVGCSDPAESLESKNVNPQVKVVKISGGDISKALTQEIKDEAAVIYSTNTDKKLIGIDPDKVISPKELTAFNEKMDKILSDAGIDLSLLEKTNTKEFKTTIEELEKILNDLKKEGNLYPDFTDKERRILSSFMLAIENILKK